MTTSALDRIDGFMAGGSSRTRWMRAMYAVNVVGAGVPGALAVLAPAWAAEAMFGQVQDPVTLRMLGSVWLAVGGVSLLGLHRPWRFSGLFPLEAAYKAVWLASSAPTLLRGERSAVLPLAGLFALWVAADRAVTPWNHLLGSSATDEG